MHYWELERITGLKKNNRSLFTVEQARELLDSLLAEYRLTLNDMQAIWGTPQLQSAHDYHSIEEVRDISYHSLCHLYSALLMDTDLFYQEDILGLSLDGGPDSVIDLQVSKKIIMLAVFRERECEFNASLFTGIHLDICQKALRVSGRNLNGIGKRMQLRGLYF